MVNRSFKIGAMLVLMVVFGAEGTLWADSPLSLDEWVERLKGLEGHKEAAFKVGPELVTLEPNFGVDVVTAAWPELTDYKVKTGLLKAFHFGKSLRPKKHPRVLKILHLGMSDKNEKVRQYAATYVKEYALEDFAGRSQAYTQWYEKYGDLEIEEVVPSNQLRRRPFVEEKLREIVEEFQKGNLERVKKLAHKIGELRHPYAIPTLIGIIDADNSYDTIYGIGYFALSNSVTLGPVTAVDFSPYHDGPWWRRWWDKNKSRFPEYIEQIQIPNLPRTEHGKGYEPYPENMDSLQGKLDYIPKALETGGDISIYLSAEITKHKDPRAIPYLIGLIVADDTYDTVYGVGYYGLSKLTDVPYDKKHDADWWTKWWQEHKSEYPLEIQQINIPDYRKMMIVWKQLKKERARKGALKDVADIPSLDLVVNNNRKMRYFLIGAGQNAKIPQEGYNLVVIMPGGGGGENFHPFVRRIYKNSLGKDFLVAQPVAFKWHEKQRIVWPTKVHPTIGQKFATEDFTEAVINDVKKRHKINDKNIFTLTWSSSGPAAYAISLQKNTAVKGSFVMASVFRRNWLPPLATAKGHVYYLLHSPQDKICPFSHAKQAKAVLTEVGAVVRLDTYEGGHGWRGNVYGSVRGGITWLMEQTQSPGSSKY